MNIVKATADYEAWMARHTQLVGDDIDDKHRKMAKAAFPFLRATYYRWASLWRKVCPDLVKAPKVLGVADLHAENFGTWRDVEGRLIWGINDFDEAFPLPYTSDLLRLAASAILAQREGLLKVAPRPACTAILSGYARAMAHGEPFVLTDGHPKLRAMAAAAEKEPTAYWQDYTGRKRVPTPRDVRALLLSRLPRGIEEDTVRFVHKASGLGSLGRQRFAALVQWQGGWVGREAKAILPSAVAWAAKFREANYYSTLASRAVRARDPFLTFTKAWSVRRLAPECSRIELTSIPKHGRGEQLFLAMGSETANAHLGSRRVVGDIQHHLKRAPRDWLYDGASRMADATYDEWKVWQKYYRGK